MPKQPRVVIIGAGIVGASIAFQLSQRQVDVTVIDRAEPGSGASSHSFAWINATVGKEPAAYHDLNRRSLDRWPHFERLLQTDIGLRWGGELRWAKTEEEAAGLRRGVIQQQQRGYDCRLLSAQEFHQLEPAIETDTCLAAAFSPNEGTGEPVKVIHACLQHVQVTGGTVYTNTEVLDCLMEENGTAGRTVTRVRTTQGDLACDVVVLAAGVATTHVAAKMGLDIPQQESPGVVIRTDPRPPLFTTISVLNTPAIDKKQQGIHIRQWSDGTVMIGEGTQESLARDDSQVRADELLARARHYLPALRGARAIPVPVGYRPMPLDELPILGFTQAVSNLYIALTHSGVTLAPLIGECSTIEILDGTRVNLLERYRLERFH